MAESVERKAMLGHKVRRFRQEQGLNQAEMAEQLGISASYLNLIERNQRPVTVQLLFRLAQAFEVDIKQFAEDDEARLVAGLKEVFADPLFEGHHVPDADVRAVAQAGPAAAQGLMQLYRAYRELAEQAHGLASRLDDDRGGAAVDSHAQAVDRVRELQQAAGNHFPELEAEAEALAADAGLEPGDGLHAALLRHLEAAHGLQVRVMPVDVMGTTMRRLDLHRRRILLSEALAPAGRTFQLAQQLGLLSRRAAIDAAVAQAGLTAEAAGPILRQTLASYLAGALMMPYEPFHRAARETRHDVGLIGRRFGAGFEQVCHRLTTLGRPGSRGVPFFFVRVDAAGNVAKRLSGGGFSFALFGGTCPRFVVHDAFRQPGTVVAQLAEMPDGQQFFTIARTVEGAGLPDGRDPPRRAVALGCDARHADQIVYADGLDLKERRRAMPIGASCRVCERLDCADRAHPPLNHRVRLEDDVRRISPFGLVGG
jgi:XRE family transcriptional regulator, fatty acid utilization regulator